MQLVMLAAGFGTRFGGLKQLTAVGPNDESIMDYTAAAAASCGYESAVVVIREEIEDDMRSHISSMWPADFPVHFVFQPKVHGTAPAVLAAHEFVTGPFTVANADDLYGDNTFSLVPTHFSTGGASSETRHLLVAYRLENTILGATQVKRGLCEVNADDELQRIAEHVITKHEDGTLEAVPFRGETDESRILDGREWVSMNLWGFHSRIFDDLERALDAHQRDDDAGELLLPEVVERLIAARQETVSVVVTEARCIGITNKDDLPIVRAEIAASTGRKAMEQEAPLR